MNAIQRDRARKHVAEVYLHVPYSGSFECDIRYWAASLLHYLVHKDGEKVSADDVAAIAQSLLDAVKKEKAEREEAAELAAELAALEAKKTP